MKKSSTSKSQSKTEIALNESEQRYRTTMMSVGDGVIATDTEGRVEMMNPVAEVLTGWLQEEAIGKPLEEVFRIINEETHKIVENPVRRVMREGIVVGLANHSVLIAKDGKEHPIADSGAPIRNEKGDITGVVLVFRDQTQERMAQKALQESERKFRETVKHLDEGYYSVTAEGSLLDHNQAFNRILGIDIDKDMKGAKLPDFWQNPDDRKVYLDELITRGFIRNYLINAKKINSEKIFVMANSHLVKDEKGGLVRIEGTFTDFTEIKHAEYKLAAAQQLYRDLFENVNVGILRTTPGPEGAFIDMNPAMVKLFEADSHEQLMALHPGNIYWDAGQRKIINDAIVANGFANVEIKFKTLKGNPLWCHINSVKKTDVNGRIYFDSTIEDFTERKRAEEALNRQHLVLEGINQIFRETIANINEETLAKMTLAIAEEITGSKFGFIGELNSQGRLDDIAISDPGWTECQMPKSNAIKLINNMEVRGIWGEAIKTGHSHIINDPANHLAWIGLPEGHPSLISFLGVPLNQAGKTIGCIALANKVIGYSLEDQVAVENIAGAFLESLNRKRAEEALKESERVKSEHFQKMNEAQHIAMIGSWEWNLKTNHVSWSDETYRIFGVTPQDFVPSFEANGKFIHPDDVERYSKSFEHSIQTGEPLDVDLRLVTNDGLLKHCNGKGKIFYDDSGQQISFIGTMMDITERKRAEEALQNSEAFLNNIIDQSPVPMWISDDKGILIRINKACCSILKITEQDVIGKYNVIEDNIVQEQGLLSDVRRVFDNGETVRFEIRYNTSKLEGFSLESEAEIILDTTIFPIKDYKGKVTNAVIQHMDITERRLAEEEIRKLNTELEDRVILRTAQLEGTNKELEAFSYSVSHDLRAPLRHVSGYVELLNKHFLSDLPEKGQHYLNSIADSVRIMGMLIDDLLQFSRTGRLEMHQSDFDMNEIVKEVIESLNKDNPDRKIEWVVGKLASVYGDEAMLRLVWMNLLSNAVKFTRTRKKARIEIGVREENKELIFFVRDNGVGFDMQYAQKLFGVFQRLHPTEEFEGTGIGLANVHRIVLRHGGRTWAKAEPDKGAVFYFSISKI